MPLWMPQTQCCSSAGSFQIAGQGSGGSHGPDTGSRAGVMADDRAVSAGEQSLMSLHPEAGICDDTTVGGHR